MWKVSIFFTATASPVLARRSGVRWRRRSPQQTLQRGNRGFIKLRAVFPQGVTPRAFTLSRISLTVRVMLSERRSPGALTAGVVAPQYSYSSNDCVKAHGDHSIIFSIGRTRLNWHPALSVFPSFPRTGFRADHVHRYALLITRQRQNGWASAPGSRAMTSSRRSVGACIRCILIRAPG